MTLDNITPNDQQQTPDETVSLLDYLHVIARHSRLIFRITLAATVISIVISLLLPNIYTAKTMILPSQEDKGMMSAMMAQFGGMVAMAGGAGLPLGGPTNADLYVSMLKSEAIKDPIIDRFTLLKLYNKKYRSDVYNKLDKNVSITAGKRDGIITVTVDDKDPKRAADMANAYVEELGKLAVRLNVTGAGQNRSFLDEQLATAKADLAKAEDKLKEFQAKNGAVHMTSQAEADIKGLAEMKAQLAGQEVQLATYRRRFTESSQDVKNLSTSVANLRGQIAKLEGGRSGSVLSVGSVPTLEQEYIRLMREFKIQESLVELLTKQYEIASFSEAKAISPFQVILKANVPERKSKPVRMKMVILSISITLLFSILLSFILENMDRVPEHNKEQWRGAWKNLCLWKKLNN
ncbi:MAG TPA: Wzz/FepE/Etk N-terminal domain-containing protein [Geobacteraceae bacterium]|nr:Wzz/FepE/Etk N-terminal domain-containing protein [Geobacteraceae bacterium]